MRDYLTIETAFATAFLPLTYVYFLKCGCLTIKAYALLQPVPSALVGAASGAAQRLLVAGHPSACCAAEHAQQAAHGCLECGT